MKEKFVQLTIRNIPEINLCYFLSSVNTISLVEKAEGSENTMKKESSKFEFLNDVAMLHSNAAQRLKMRMSIMSSIGPHRRALCARKDLSIRRYLCKVSKVGSFSQDDQNKS